MRCISFLMDTQGAIERGAFAFKQMPCDMMSASACFFRAIIIIFKVFIHKSLEVYVWTIGVFYG